MPLPDPKFNHALLSWFERAKRQLPWRDTRDPYVHWVSEVMLQQTQVAAMLPFYKRWMESFPTIQALAEASEHDVLAAWAGLGYYRRARMLQAGAQFVLAHGLPQTSQEWRDVPGVGEYTAGAIASMTVGEPVPAVDGNVKRVYSRLAADPSSGQALFTKATQWAAQQLDAEYPGEWNEALMELGATICRPKNPQCPACPISSWCAAHADGTQAQLPARPEPAAKLEKSFFVLVPVHDRWVGLVQIQKGPWWRGMWEFPRFETHEDRSIAVGTASSVELGEFKTTVTKHRLLVDAVLARQVTQDPELRWVNPSEAERLPLPAVQKRILNAAKTVLQTEAATGSAPGCCP